MSQLSANTGLHRRTMQSLWQVFCKAMHMVLCIRTGKTRLAVVCSHALSRWPGACPQGLRTSLRPCSWQELVTGAPNALKQDPQVTLHGRAMQTQPAQPMSAWLSNATTGRELDHHAAARSRSSTQVRASFAARHGGARAAAHALHRACLRERRRRTPRSHLTRAPARPASSAGLAASARHKRLGAAAARCGARACRSKLRSSRVRPCLADTQPAPSRARSRLPPLSRTHTRLDSCGGRRGCPRRRPLGFAACARCGRFAPSLYPWPHRARTAIARRWRGGRCASRSARRGVCRACLPDARVALAVCQHRCAPSSRDGRGRGAAGAGPALGEHPHGRRPMASSGARRRSGPCPSRPLHTQLRRRHRQGVRLGRGPVGLSAHGRGAARLSLRLSEQPRVPLLERGIRALAQAQAAMLHSSQADHAVAAPWRDALSSAVTGQTRKSTMVLAGCALVSSVRHAPLSLKSMPGPPAGALCSCLVACLMHYVS